MCQETITDPTAHSSDGNPMHVSNQIAEQMHVDAWLSKGTANKNYTAKDKQVVIRLLKLNVVAELNEKWSG